MNDQYEPLVGSNEASKRDAADKREVADFQSFEAFSNASVMGVPVKDSPAPSGAQDATRIINIPELPSASAEWHSSEVSHTFILAMVASVLLLMQSLPLALFLLGVPGLISSVVGIIMASMRLFENCQSNSLDADVTVVTILANVCIVLDAFTAIVFLVLIRVLARDADEEFHENFNLVVLAIVYCGLPLIHLWACLMARGAARKLKNLMRPVRAGMIVLT